MIDFNTQMYRHIVDVEQAIYKKRPVDLSFLNGTKSIYPHRVVFLDGQLTLIGEVLSDPGLIGFDLTGLHKVAVIETNELISSQFSDFEVDSFIRGVRALNGNEARLILRITDCASVNLAPRYHYMGNPCLVVNPQGQFIWAANVEPAECLFSWLYSQREYIEILEPSFLKDLFDEYCFKAA